LAASSFGPAAASWWRSTRRARFLSSGMDTSTGTTLAVAPDGSASNALGRAITSLGFGPDRVTSTTLVPPKIWVWAYSGESRSVTLLMSVEPVIAWSRPATSLES
jgi:hypothetical protein